MTVCISNSSPQSNTSLSTSRLRLLTLEAHTRCRWAARRSRSASLAHSADRLPDSHAVPGVQRRPYYNPDSSPKPQKRNPKPYPDTTIGEQATSDAPDVGRRRVSHGLHLRRLARRRRPLQLELHAVL